MQAYQPIAEIMTFATPLAIVMYPTKKRIPMIRSALWRWMVLIMMRSIMVVCTVLPRLLPDRQDVSPSLIFGQGRDYIFSGHTAFIASWIIEYYRAGAIPFWALTAWSTTSAALIIASRMHYTIDVILAWTLACMIASISYNNKRTVELRFVKNREDLFSLRHAVYATELGQYEENETGRLEDEYANHAIGAYVGEDLVGFVCVTPPGGPYALERHVPMTEWRLPLDEGLFEIRALTVKREYRRLGIAKSLMYAAYRYGECLGATNLVVMAREELVPLYEKIGLENVGPRIECGRATYTVMHCRSTFMFSKWWKSRPTTVPVVWNLPFLKKTPKRSFHGGREMTLEGPPPGTIHADVLDAWYPPSPEVLNVVRRSSLINTSPPHDAAQLVDAISSARGVSPERIVLGNGSSDLIFRCFLHWLGPGNRVYLPRPTYSEYVHVLEHVVGCTVDDEYDDAATYDMVVFVNPNSPTGTYDPYLKDVIRNKIPESTRVWVDETYLDYVGAEHSLETISNRRGLIVCKSMSKIYGLSGLRVAYACMHPTDAETIRQITPPWTPGGIAQAAGVAALGDSEYYEARMRETHATRKRLEESLASMGYEVLDGASANFITVFVDDGAADFRKKCIEHGGVYVRDVSSEFKKKSGAVRIAIRSPEETDRMIEIFKKIT